MLLSAGHLSKRLMVAKQAFSHKQENVWGFFLCITLSNARSPHTFPHQQRDPVKCLLPFFAQVWFCNVGYFFKLLDREKISPQASFVVIGTSALPRTRIFMPIACGSTLFCIFCRGRHTQRIGPSLMVDRNACTHACFLVRTLKVAAVLQTHCNMYRMRKWTENCRPSTCVSP